jgi:hypothetical protein
MPTHTRALLASCCAIGVVTLLLLMPLPENWQGDWQGKVFDLGHVPLFAGLVLVLRWLLGRTWPWPVLLSLALAALAELVQGACGRSASVLDFVRGALGIGIAVLVIRAWQGPWHAGRLAGHLLAIAALLAWPVANALPYLLDAYEGWQSFPTLADFQTAGQALRWDCQQARLERVADPVRPGKWRGRLDLFPGPEDYPGAALKPILQDFTGHRRLYWSLTTEDPAVTLVFSIRSRGGQAAPSNHYQFARRFAPGAHRVSVDLSAFVSLAQPEPLDLSRIMLVQVFVVRPERATIVFLERIWLE